MVSQESWIHVHTYGHHKHRSPHLLAHHQLHKAIQQVLQGFGLHYINALSLSLSRLYPPPLAQALPCPSSGARLTVVFLIFSDHGFCGQT